MNQNVALTLDEAVQEVLGLLTGLDLQYAPEMDRYRVITRQLNRALRNNALEQEWSYYSDVETVGTASAGMKQVYIRGSRRLRVINDDSVRFVNDHGDAVVWAYILPRDALHKYSGQRGLYAAVTRDTLEFSKPLPSGLDGLEIQIPVMREPRMFRLPAAPEDPNAEQPTVSQEVRDQLVDFDFPDIIIARAAYQYAQSDPVMQPRAQTLEQEYKNMHYALVERDDRHTESPFMNDFLVPIQNGLDGWPGYHQHPHSDDRR